MENVLLVFLAVPPVRAKIVHNVCLDILTSMSHVFYVTRLYNIVLLVLHQHNVLNAHWALTVLLMEIVHAQVASMLILTRLSPYAHARIIITNIMALAHNAQQ